MNLSQKNIIKIWTEKNNFSILPERWAIVTSVILDWKEILFQKMLKETLFDLTKSVRWWIPIMFPQTGVFTQEVEEKLGYFLPQHWIVRIYSWQVLEIWKNFIKLKFDDKMQTWEYKIPQKFEIIMTCEIWEKKFKIDFEIKNFDEKDLKISHWFHPYFALPKWKDSIFWDKNILEKQNQTIYFPSKDLKFEEKILKNKSFSEIILKNSEIWKNDWTLSLDLPENWFSFEIEKIWKIKIKTSKDLKKIWLRSDPKKDFVCVEPVVWNVWNIAKNPEIIKENQVLKSFFEIIFEK